MSDYKPTSDQIQALLKYASKKLGVTPEELKKTLEGDAARKMVSKLSSDDAAKFQEVVGNKDKMEKMLQSPQAKQLIEKFLNNSGN
jgi:hypothetical protein